MSCLHDHDCADHSCATHWSLHEHIDLSKVRRTFFSIFFRFRMLGFSCLPHRLVWFPICYYFDNALFVIACAIDQVSALNEAVIGSVKSVFKSWDRRLDTSEVSIAFL